MSLLSEELNRLKKENPSFGYKKLSKLAGCNPSTAFYFLKPGYKKTRNKSQTFRRNEIMTELKIENGGKCQRCGYSKCMPALHFHHRDPSEKSFEISRVLRNMGKGIELAKQECKKCDLLCSNCHIELHNPSLIR